MSFPSLLFIILFLRLSMYVCTARPLVAVDEASNVQFNISGKVPENVKKHTVESSAVTKKEGIKSIGGAITQRSKPTKAVDIKKLKSSSEQEDLPGLGHAGSDEVPKFCYMDLLNPIIVKVSRRRALSVIGPANVKKDADTKEDVEVKDYTEPHQTPPIHNRET